MADGDYSQPVFPGVVGIGSNGNCRNNEGLQGKDSVQLHSLQTSLNDTSLSKHVSNNSKTDAILTVENKFEAAKNQKDTEIRLERTSRETQLAIVQDGEKTRLLMASMEAARLQAAQNASVNAALAAIQAQLAILLP